MLVAALAAEDPICETTHQTPGWTLEKSSDPASGSTVQPGSSVTYTLTATNDSEGVVTGAVATDDLSDVLNHASLDAVPEGATLTGTTLTWNIPELEPGIGDAYLQRDDRLRRLQRDHRQRGYAWARRQLRRLLQHRPQHTPADRAPVAADRHRRVTGPGRDRPRPHRRGRVRTDPPAQREDCLLSDEC